MADTVVPQMQVQDLHHLAQHAADFTNQEEELQQHLPEGGIDPNVDPALATELQVEEPTEPLPIHPELPEDDVSEEAAIEGHEELSMDGIEPFSPRRGFTHKRNEDPPRNEAGKMMCKFQSTCAGVTFDRRCEWSKHMDKHERPYKCQQAGCEKLQGFTYSGGLLRHQREVHKMHGGTKKALYCPEPNCKRNSGAGFTRKENLSEHIRRVHRRQTDGTPLDGSSAAPMANMQASTIEQLEAAAREQFDLTDPELKRKRDDLAVGAPFEDAHTATETHQEVDTLRDEVKRLKTDVVDRDSRLQNLEDQLRHQAALIQQLIDSASVNVAKA